jgi:hypothetical protein
MCCKGLAHMWPPGQKETHTPGARRGARRGPLDRKKHTHPASMRGPPGQKETHTPGARRGPPGQKETHTPGARRAPPDRKKHTHPVPGVAPLYRHTPPVPGVPPVQTHTPGARRRAQSSRSTRRSMIHSGWPSQPRPSRRRARCPFVRIPGPGEALICRGDINDIPQVHSSVYRGDSDAADCDVHVHVRAVLPCARRRGCANSDARTPGTAGGPSCARTAE